MKDFGKTLTLHNGVKMPRLGLGVWKIQNEKVDWVVVAALQAGYRMIDTAKVYGNEIGVGKGIRDSGLAREQVFVTTKLAAQDLLKPEKSFRESLERLRMAYVDLYLIHWPFIGWQGAWRTLEKMYEAGLARSIGVSNFDIRHLEEMKQFGKIVPMANEVEITPFLYRKALIEYCGRRKIAVIAYSPLATGKQFGTPTLVGMAEKYGKSEAQIMIRWGLQHQLIMIPKAETVQHIKENAEVYDFAIASQDVKALDLLNRNHSMMPLWSRG